MIRSAKSSRSRFTRAAAVALMIAFLLPGCIGDDDVAGVGTRAEVEDVVVADGERYAVNATAGHDVTRVHAEVAVRHAGSEGEVFANVGLVAPDGTVLAHEEAALDPGDSRSMTLEHAFTDGSGAPGRYRIVVFAQEGAVTLERARLTVDAA